MSTLAEDENYPHIKDAVLTLHKNRHHFPKIKRTTQYSPEIEKLARFIEKKMAVKTNQKVKPSALGSQRSTESLSESNRIEPERVDTSVTDADSNQSQMSKS